MPRACDFRASVRAGLVFRFDLLRVFGFLVFVALSVTFGSGGKTTLGCTPSARCRRLSSLAFSTIAVNWAIRSAACDSVFTCLRFASWCGLRCDAGSAAHSRCLIWSRSSADGRRFLSNDDFGVFGTLTMGRLSYLLRVIRSFIHIASPGSIP